MRRYLELLRLALLCMLLAVPLGCGKKSGTGATVTGQVTLDGKPVTMGSVVIRGEEGTLARGGISESGQYQVPDAPLGEVKVYLEFPPSLSANQVPGMVMDEQTKEKMKMMSDQEAALLKGAQAKDLGKVQGKMSPVVSEENIKRMKEMELSVEGLPDRYKNPLATPLRTTVGQGETKFDIAAKRDAKPN
jgi:hypothetical protein